MSFAPFNFLKGNSSRCLQGPNESVYSVEVKQKAR